MDAINLSQISDNYSCTNQCLKVKHFPSLPWCINRPQVEKTISNSTLKLHLLQPALWSAFSCLSTSLCLYCNSKYYKRLQSNASPGAIVVEDANPPLRNNSLKHSTLDDIFTTEQKDQIVFFREHLHVHFTLC